MSIKEIAEQHAEAYGGLDSANQARLKSLIELAICEAAAPLVAALEACHSAMDSMMGDSDIDGDDSPEMLACQQTMVALSEWRASK